MNHKVLIVEDVPQVTNMYRKKLEQAGLVVDTAANGEIALEKISQFNPDLVLLDILMPGVSGLDVLRRIRTNVQTRNMLVIVTTNSDSDELATAIQNIGVSGYMTKSNFTPKEVVDKVISALGGLDS